MVTGGRFPSVGGGPCAIELFDDENLARDPMERIRKGDNAMALHDRVTVYGTLILGVMLAMSTLSCGSRPPIEGRVPATHIEKALALQAPFGDARQATPEIVAAGKALYEGKGTCYLCHGVSGRGDGPASQMQGKHPPRDFTNCAVQKERKDGELFWTIKHGSAGTGMPSLIPSLLTEEEGWNVVAYLRTFCKAGG